MKGSRILVVEDEALIADDIQRTLVRLGYDVPTTAATGLEAIAVAAELKPGLALMDIKLQGAMDGIEAAIVIRREYDIPVVYLTSHSDDATLERAMETSPSGYLIKPFSDRELRTAIEVALHKHHLEVELAERERWFSTTLQSIGDAVIATDRAEKVTFMNAVAEQLTGWRNADALGLHLGEVFQFVDGAGNPMAGPSKRPLQSSFSVELPPTTTLIPRGGGYVSVDDNAAEIIDAKGRALGRVVVFRDVTERRKLEQRLAQSEHLASLGTLAAGMGHEINNPLAAVVANLEFVTERVVTQMSAIKGVQPQGAREAIVDIMNGLAEIQDALRDATDGAERVRSIVVDLKKFVSGERASKAVLELSEVIESAAKMASHTVRHHATVIKEYGITPYVEANEGQLVQVFTNLLMNAVQSIPDGQADRTIRLVTYTDVAGRAVAEVRDNGSGMGPQVLPKIFEPFFTTKSFGAGMGLGLAICHSIIAASGGEIVVESSPGQGTVFRVALPGAVSKELSRASGVASNLPRERAGRLLIVDDDPSIARALERILGGDHHITTVYTGSDALAKIATGEGYDVIFCDLMMPGMSGVEVYKSLAAANPEQARRIVFMTGGAVTRMAEEFLAATENATIAKPFQAEAVRAIARDYAKHPQPSCPRGPSAHDR